MSYSALIFYIILLFLAHLGIYSMFLFLYFYIHIINLPHNEKLFIEYTLSLLIWSWYLLSLRKLCLQKYLDRMCDIFSSTFLLNISIWQENAKQKCISALKQLDCHRKTYYSSITSIYRSMFSHSWFCAKISQ